MKKLFIAAGMVALGILSGCTTLKPIPIIPPAQLAQDVCPIVQADLDLLAASPLLSAAQQAKLTGTIIPDNNLACSTAATVDLTNLQTFNATAFPALMGIVAAVPSLPGQPGILLGLQLAQPVLNGIVNNAIATSQTVAPAVPASGVTQ